MRYTPPTPIQVIKLEAGGYMIQTGSQVTIIRFERLVRGTT